MRYLNSYVTCLVLSSPSWNLEDTLYSAMALAPIDCSSDRRASTSRVNFITSSSRLCRLSHKSFSSSWESSTACWRSLQCYSKSTFAAFSHSTFASRSVACFSTVAIASGLVPDFNSRISTRNELEEVVEYVEEEEDEREKPSRPDWEEIKQGVRKQGSGDDDREGTERRQERTKEADVKISIHRGHGGVFIGKPPPAGRCFGFLKRETTHW
ncbi:hypothetical protein B296_00057325 [Ensete ventricosum]|uniref:Uncharacterized protein n=1 Tax=Ensete ventricosum TaxID=4639 RepID=A0A426X101_ENSVE|nr:hypothetical protein B296_00057325 [Ensete ventricosum]